MMKKIKKVSRNIVVVRVCVTTRETIEDRFSLIQKFEARILEKQRSPEVRCLARILSPAALADRNHRYEGYVANVGEMLSK